MKKRGEKKREQKLRVSREKAPQYQKDFVPKTEKPGLTIGRKDDQQLHGNGSNKHVSLFLWHCHGTTVATEIAWLYRSTNCRCFDM